MIKKYNYTVAIQFVLITFTYLFTQSTPLIAQTIPVGAHGLEDYYRRAQLMGQLDSAYSFAIRPLSPKYGLKDPAVFFPEANGEKFKLLGIPYQISKDNDESYVTLLPFSLQLQNNSHHPFGINDGGMIPAKGIQTVISGGIYASVGPLSIQLYPQFVNAANKDFEVFDKDHYEIIKARYYDFYNRIDAPVRFGTEKYSSINWGQSSIRINYNSFSFGLSNENLWWGPGLRNSLVMTNNAPGFKHLTLNTTEPIRTSIGSFEGQLIAGRLEGSGFGPLEPDGNYYNSPLAQEKINDWRLLSGLVLTWQPKWVPGLFLGLTKTAQTYSQDVKNIGDVLPFSSPRVIADVNEGLKSRDSRSSLFMRWLWAEEQAEFYIEFGYNNNKKTARQAALNASKNRGYVAGIRKILNLGHADKLLLEVEATQLQQTEVEEVFAMRSWYLHPYVRHGYTHKGQILGAGIGPGANMQTMQVSWLNGMKRLGLQFERLVHNNDFYFYSYIDSSDPRRHWYDMSLALSGELNYKNFLFNAKLQGVKSYNYQWYLFQPPTATTYWVNGKDAVNFQSQLGITYRF